MQGPAVALNLYNIINVTEGLEGWLGGWGRGNSKMPAAAAAQDAAFAEIACHRAGRHLPPSLPSNQLGLILDLPGFNCAMA